CMQGLEFPPWTF
nr:immunoglobulin light chain junction region [Macaca mulatta]